MGTHTYALMDVSRTTYEEVREKLLAAGYEHAITGAGRNKDVLDMHGIALQLSEEPSRTDPSQSYAACERMIETLPLTWIPALLRVFVRTAGKKHVFKEGGLEVFIAGCLRREHD